jgi:hypothetical protein
MTLAINSTPTAAAAAHKANVILATRRATSRYVRFCLSCINLGTR